VHAEVVSAAGDNQIRVLASDEEILHHVAEIVWLHGCSVAMVECPCHIERTARLWVDKDLEGSKQAAGYNAPRGGSLSLSFTARRIHQWEESWKRVSIARLLVWIDYSIYIMQDRKANIIRHH